MIKKNMCVKDVCKSMHYTQSINELETQPRWHLRRLSWSAELQVGEVDQDHWSAVSQTGLSIYAGTW